MAPAGRREIIFSGYLSRANRTLGPQSPAECRTHRAFYHLEVFTGNGIFRLVLRTAQSSSYDVDLSCLRVVGQRPMLPNSIILDFNPPEQSSPGASHSCASRTPLIEYRAAPEDVKAWIRAFQTGVALVEKYGKLRTQTSSASKDGTSDLLPLKKTTPVVYDGFVRSVSNHSSDLQNLRTPSSRPPCSPREEGDSDLRRRRADKKHHAEHQSRSPSAAEDASLPRPTPALRQLSGSAQIPAPKHNRDVSYTSQLDQEAASGKCAQATCTELHSLAPRYTVAHSADAQKDIANVKTIRVTPNEEGFLCIGTSLSTATTVVGVEPLSTVNTLAAPEALESSRATDTTNQGSFNCMLAEPCEEPDVCEDKMTSRPLTPIALADLVGTRVQLGKMNRFGVVKGVDIGTGRYEVLLEDKNCTIFLHGEILVPIGVEQKESPAASSVVKAECDTALDESISFNEECFLFHSGPFPEGEPCWSFPLFNTTVEKQKCRLHHKKRSFSRML